MAEKLKRKTEQRESRRQQRNDIYISDRQNVQFVMTICVRGVINNDV